MKDIRVEAFAAHKTGDLETAERLYNNLLRTLPSDAEVLHYMGVLCYQKGHVASCMQWLYKALECAPGTLPTLQLLIRACIEEGDVVRTLDILNRYLKLQPSDATMINLKGQQLVRLGRLREAGQVLSRAVDLSGSGAMYSDLGLCHKLQGDQVGAITAFQEAIRRNCGQARTRLWLAQCLRSEGRIGEYYQVATAASETFSDDLGLLVEAQAARRYVCDWKGFQSNQPQLLTHLSHVLEADTANDIPPGVLNFLDIDEGMITAIAKLYARQLSMGGKTLRQQFQKIPAKKSQKIRLGYISADFFTHAIGSLVRDLFSNHDRDRFEVYGYSLRHQPDAVQVCIQQGCDHYRIVSNHSAGEVAEIINNDQIDILIDLAGYTSSAQPAVLAARPAPVQITWLGYLGTSGSDYIDYIIADEVVLPPELACNYTEKAIRLPRFLVASPLPIAEKNPSREEEGLNPKGVVFCSFNQLYKLDQLTFEAWMEILRHVPDSRLWLYAPDSETCVANLRSAASRLDIKPDRLVFTSRVSMAEHVARTSLADLMLDPFHISGGATSVTNLAAGVPILALRGKSFLARMGSSINSYLGLGDLDCSTSEQYITKAVELATMPLALSNMKDKLGVALQTSGFFDTKSFARSLESALLVVWERHVAGLPTDDITISGSPYSTSGNQQNLDNG